MSKVEYYIDQLKQQKDWIPYLLKESGLPGPRGNLELAAAVVELGDEETFKNYIKYTPEKAPVNSPEEFLAFCGVFGLGKLYSNGSQAYLPILKQFASDPRWRTREAVAMALQRIGKNNIEDLLKIVSEWSSGSLLEQRAAMAGICEPVLLKDKVVEKEALDILDKITEQLQNVTDKKSEEFRVLKKALSYGWSVAIVANPEYGKKLFEKLAKVPDKDIKSIVKENLKKNRLIKMDPKWITKVMS
jgi:hypothetical protein